MLHPHHDRLRAEVASWYHTPAPVIGYQIERRRFGFYRRNVANPRSARIILEDATPHDVEALLAGAREYFGESEIDLWIDDRSKDAILGPALVDHGCTRSDSTIYLAHVGPLPEASGPAHLVIEPVAAANLRDFVLVKLKAFANSEDEPSPERVAEEMAVREAEMRGPGRFFTVRIVGENAAILAYYEGTDRLIFNLATRVPFRMRGIAKLLLHRTLADSRDRGCRSVIINTNPEDTPITWYRRIGFTDEVYWRQTYLYRPDIRTKTDFARPIS